MNPKLLLIFALFGVLPTFAQFAVIDIKNIEQSVINYSALTKQIANQAVQIANQLQQIRQFETQLERMGDMANVKDLLGFSELRLDLDLPTQVKKWADGVAKVDGRGLFGDTRGGIFPEIKLEFPGFDGSPILRSPELFKQAHDLVVTVDEFKTVQSDVYTRREDLKKAIATTSDALQSAATEAEEKKLQAVLTAQYGQLSAVDAEVSMSAAQVQVKTAEAAAMTQAQNDADAEARGRISQQEVSKVSTVFKPTYESMLQYVREKPLSR